MSRAAVYARISRDRVGAGLGVDRQERECRELADRLGLTIAAVYIDNDLSAYSGKPRPEYLRMLAAIEAGLIDVVLAWHTDRLHRSPTELERYITVCEARGVPTHTAKAGPLDLATPSGRLVARQLGAVARYEVEHSVERQQAAKQQAAVAGKWGGGRRPFGYAKDGVTIVAAEAKAVADATDAILLGSSVRSQALELNRAGILTATGRAWTPTELRKVLTRARNAGLREHRGDIIGKAVWEPLVPEEKWRAVTAMLTDPARRTTPGPARRWLLSGLARCGVCDGPLIVTMLTSTKNSVPSYACRDGKHVVRNAAELERFVELLIVERLKQPDTRKLLRPRAAGGVDVAALSAEQANLQQRLDDLADNLDLDERTLARRSAKLRERLAQIAGERALAGRGNPLSGIVDAADPAAAWAASDLDRKRACIDMLMTVVVQRTSRGRPAGWQPGHSYFNELSIDVGWTDGS